MANDKFSIGEAVGFGWETFKNNIGFFILLLIIVIIPNVLDGVFEVLAKQIGIPGFIILLIKIVFFVINAGFTMGVINIAIQFADGKEPGFGDLFSCFGLFFKYFFGLIIYGLIVILGLILLIIPGIIWAIKYGYFMYLIVDKNLGPIQSIKRSGQITQGVKWDLFFLNLSFFGLAILGLLACCIGLFAAWPTIMVGCAYVYRKLEPLPQPPPPLYQQTPMA